MARQLARLSVYLLLGAIVNLAVAWGCAALVAVDFSRREDLTSERAREIVLARMPDARDYWSIDGARAGAVGITLEAAAVWQPVYFLSGEEPQFDLVWHGASDFSIFRDGLPLRSMEGERHRHDTDWYPAGSRAAWPHYALWRPDWLEARLLKVKSPGLPLRPIWPGFAINTLFYAAILWLLFAAPGSIRRWRRIRCGLCPACAYPVGTSPTCTECGAAIPSPSG